MNALTEQFFQADFPGWKPRKDFDTVWTEFWTTREIPIVELNLGIDTESSCRWIHNNQERFALAWTQTQYNQHSKNLGHNWFQRPHSQGRWDLQIAGQCPQHRKLLDDKPWQEFDYEQQVIYKDAVPELQAQLLQQGLAIYSMKIAKLDPGGYLEPHKDSMMMSETMTHLWIPLNPAPNNLKIWPWGMLEHRIGSVYLLNNQTFMHAISNNSADARYVATAKIDHEMTSPQLIAKIRSAVKQQWFS